MRHRTLWKLRSFLIFLWVECDVSAEHQSNHGMHGVNGMRAAALDMGYEFAGLLKWIVFSLSQQVKGIRIEESYKSINSVYSVLSVVTYWY